METPGAVPMTEQAVWGMGSARKPRAPSRKPVLSGLAVASDPVGFWEEVGPDCAVATPLPPVTDNVGRAKKKKASHGDLMTMNKNANLSAKLVSICARRFSPDVGHSWTWIRKQVVFTHDSKPQGEWVRVAELMMIKFSESGHPVFRATSPLSRGTLKSRGGGKLSIHFCADGRTIETVFRTIISVNQLSIHGADSDLCEEYKACHVRTERLVMAGQSNPLFAPTSSLMKTPTPSTDDTAQEDLLQKYQEGMERLSQQNRVIKICSEARFLTTVDVGQYFMTKDTEEFLTIYRVCGLS